MIAIKRNKFKIIVAAVGVVLMTISDGGAVIDTTARSASFSFKGALVRKPGPTSQFSKSLAHFTMGIIYDDEEAFDSAIREYKQALAVTPDVSYIHTRLAVDYILVKDNSRAIDELKAAKALDPGDARPKLLTALVYTSLNKFEEARKEYEEVTRLDPESIWALSNLADILVLQKKLNEAAAIYEKLLEKEGASEAIYIALGYMYAEAGRFQDALKIFTAAQELDKNDPKPHFYLGMVYDRMKQKALAIKELREAIKLAPAFSDAYNYLGYMFVEDGINLDEAMILIKKAIEIEPDNGAYVDSLGWAYFKKGMLYQALEELEKAVKLEPNEPEIKGHLETVREKLKNL